MHGGVLCTLLDTVVGCAVHTTLEAGWGYTSIDLNVTYLRPVTLKTGMLTAVGTLTKGGRRVSFASGEIRDAAGAVIATGTSSLLMFEPGALAGLERGRARVARRAAESGLDDPAALEGAPERDLVGVLEVAADGETRTRGA